MNKRFDPNENRPANPAAWPSEQASQRIDPVTQAPINDPMANPRTSDLNPREPRKARSSWPILIILLAGLVLALLVWLPSEMATDQTNDAATQPAPTDTTTPPATDTATPPATPDTSTAPATPETTPPPATPDTSTAPATPAPDTSATPATPETGTTTPPATGTAPAPAPAQ